ncbi:MAG: DMT family transporter [Proteobacteria bacterium]|nr:DMT family transporter [Pseudomonadota bacterium]
MLASASRNNLIGIASLCLGSLVFSMQDMVIKAISGDYAVTLAVSLRAVVSFPILVAMVALSGGLAQIATPYWPIMLLRGFTLLCAYTTYFMAFPALPMSEAIALYLMVPVFVTLMSAPLLGERVTLKSAGAVLIGLLGVFVILRPGFGVFEPAALLSLTSAAAYAYSMILARKHGAGVQASVMSFYSNIVYLLAPIAFAGVMYAFQVQPPGHPSVDFLVRPWTIPAPRDMALMGLCGVIAAFGSVLLSHAYRVGQAAVVTPFEYTGMIWVSLLAFLLFGEVPEPLTILGMMLIAMAGVLALRAGTRAA